MKFFLVFAIVTGAAFSGLNLYLPKELFGAENPLLIKTAITAAAAAMMGMIVGLVFNTVTHLIEMEKNAAEDSPEPAEAPDDATKESR